MEVFLRSQGMRLGKQGCFFVNKYNTILRKCKFLVRDSPMKGEINERKERPHSWMKVDREKDGGHSQSYQIYFLSGASAMTV
jgi:hypothetical protein